MVTTRNTMENKYCVNLCVLSKKLMWGPFTALHTLLELQLLPHWTQNITRYELKNVCSEDLHQWFFHLILHIHSPVGGSLAEILGSKLDIILLLRLQVFRFVPKLHTVIIFWAILPNSYRSKLLLVCCTYHIPGDGNLSQPKLPFKKFWLTVG